MRHVFDPRYGVSGVTSEDIAGSISTPYGFDRLREVLKSVTEGIQKQTWGKDSVCSQNLLSTICFILLMFIYSDSHMTDVLNPKVAIFFMPFFPQFVRTDHGNPVIQLFWLGALVTLVAIPVETFLLLQLHELQASLGRIPKHLSGSNGCSALYLYRSDCDMRFPIHSQ